MIYCFDIDKTLCSQNTYSETTTYLADPFLDRIKKVNKLYDEGHTIIIETARGSRTGLNWEPFTKKQLKKWGVKYHQLRTGVKIFADYYIDDKAISDIDFFT